MRSGFLTDDFDEQRLIEQVKNGDRNAFESLVEPYGKALCNYIAYRVKNEADAGDIIQETMLSIWQSIASYDFRSSFKTWMFGIAKRRQADFYRKNGKNETLPLTDFENTLTAKDSINESIERMDIKQALAKLSDSENELVYLVFQANLSYQEISALLKIPAGTVKSRMSSIKAKLKLSLWQEGEQ